mmetsp:Transcript_17392/g.41572  ORF Transcript_17392/g.41572 Transcript_17392/m.41572 type:complete len:239 (+) Transcript_17392:302-1018(+)
MNTVSTLWYLRPSWVRPHEAGIPMGGVVGREPQLLAVGGWVLRPSAGEATARPGGPAADMEASAPGPSRQPAPSAWWSRKAPVRAAVDSSLPDAERAARAAAEAAADGVRGVSAPCSSSPSSLSPTAALSLHALPEPSSLVLSTAPGVVSSPSKLPPPGSPSSFTWPTRSASPRSAAGSAASQRPPLPFASAAPAPLLPPPAPLPSACGPLPARAPPPAIAVGLLAVTRWSSSLAFSR